MNNQPSPWTPSQRLSFAAILILAAGLRLYQLSERPVWCDEPYFWFCSSHPGWLVTLIHSVADDVYPPLFYLLLHGISLFTTDLFMIRLPMALAGLGAVWVLVGMMRRAAGNRAALFAGALAAASPLLVYYSQEAKMYSILALFLLLLLDETLRCLNDTARGWGRLALWALLAVYTFYLAVFVWLALVLLAWWQTRSEPWRANNVFKGFGVAALGFLPWSPFFLKSILVNQGSVFNFFMDRILLFSFQNFSTGFWISHDLEWAALIAFAAAASLALAGPEYPRRRLAGLLLGLAILPLGFSWIVSLMAKPMYSDRAMLVSAMAWLALAGLGLSRLRPAVGLAGLALLLSVNTYALKHYYFDPSSQRVDYKPAWEQIQAQWKPGDTVFHQSIESYYPFKFFAWQQDQEHPKPNWIYSEPPAFTPNKGANLIREAWRKVNAWLKDRGMGVYTGYNLDFVAGERLQNQALPGVKRLWYVNADRQASARLWMPQMNVYLQGYSGWSAFEPEKMDWLQRQFSYAGQTRVAEVDLYLFERKGN